jgi:hypothetical protein
MEPRGSEKRKRKHPFRLGIMPKACLDLAAAYRREAGTGRRVAMTSPAGGSSISCTEAAARLEAQAARWQHEIDTGEPAIEDRKRIGEW